MHSNEKKKKKKILIYILVSIFCLGMGSGLFLLYGPYSGFRDWLITTAMNTMSHQYLATWFYSDKTIAKVLEKNKLTEPSGNTNTDLIDGNESTFYANEYEKEVLSRKKGTLYKIIDIKGDTYSGYLAVIYNPSKISVVTASNLGYSGEYLVDMAKRKNAVLAINGGGFFDTAGQGDGGTPVGIIIENGVIKNWTRYYNNGGLIGFTKDNKLYLGRVDSAEAALAMGIRDAVEFGPFLIVNGEAAFTTGNGGYGLNPRTVIGQRKDGIVLMLVIDGRRVGCMGIDMGELTDIMVRYGAYNAANLDGGNSSVMVVNNKIINHPINWDNMEATRPIATGFIVAK